MRRTVTILFALTMAMLFMACPGLDRVLEVNMYEPFAGVSDAAIKDADSGELLEMSASDSFYESLAEDPAAETAALATIDVAMETAVGAEYEELAALAAMILLETSPAGELMENISLALPTLASGDSNIDTAVILQSMLPQGMIVDGVIVDEEDFAEMVDALVAANDYYVLLGNEIGADGYTSDDISAGDIATAALMSAIVASVSPPASDPDMTTSELLLIMLDPDTDPDDPLLEGSSFEMPDMETGYLANLLAAGGISFGGAPDEGSGDEGSTEPSPGESFASIQ